jgi:ABC-type transporter Mla MlaB component
VSKHLLKEMMERKQRNDFVRKREFDMLRTVRKREAMVGHDAVARPSFFQSSLPASPDDRASTLKKIDEIEAQMSMQWWKTGPRSALDSVKVPQPGGSQSAAAGPSMQNIDMPAGYGPTEPFGLQPPAPVAQQPADRTLEMTEPSPLMARRPMVASDTGKTPPLNGLSWGGGSYDNGTSGFTPSNLVAMDVAEVAHDAELEEASIQFANGDDAGAEAGLLEMLGPKGSRKDHPETWLTLFDLYRATGQQDKFEAAAIRFLERFDRSAPQWFSMPGMVQSLATSERKLPGNGPAADWICPSTLGIQTVATLRAALARAPMPWRLDWSNLKSVEAAAVDALFKLFSSWSSEPVQLRFIGDSQLQQVLQNGTPSGDRDAPEDRWKLRMEALRVTHRPDEFELTALDFCVTYEVSPPAWEDARCEYKPLGTDGLAIAGHTIIGDVYRESQQSVPGSLDGDTYFDTRNSQMAQIASIELSGQVQGDAIGVLDQLDSRLMGADVMMISCLKLIRVDFSAAGTLLNWVSARQAENRTVQFTDVNRLVAAFFNVIGITEHARVISRTD